MEERTFKTLIKNDESVRKAWRDNHYVYGVVFGILLGTTGKTDRGDHQLYPVENGRIYETKCDKEKYAIASKIIETTYPDLCEFDVE